MAANPLTRLAALGQSIWFDFIRRDLLQNGELERLIREDAVRGMTSNPTIFDKAIGSSALYDSDVRAAGKGATAAQVFEGLAVADVRRAADLFRAVYDDSGARDGFVSIEVSPALAYETQATIDEARRLWRACDRPNVMIKIPGTQPGLSAIERCLADGININVTLLFAVERYREVISAWLAAVEHRVAKGLPVQQLASVASFFVSRIDNLADSLIEARLNEETDPGRRSALEALLGSVAIANAKVAAQRAAAIYGDSRWQALVLRGAHPQRLLWASTSTKNPTYRDVLYVEELIGPDTVNTLPDATLKAYVDHGFARMSLAEEQEAAAATIASLAALGIDYAALTEKLLVDGVKQFADAYDAMVRSIATKQQELQPAASGR